MPERRPRRPRRPAGWVAPGPRPPASDDAHTGPDEDLCYLTGDWRLYQRVDGHRWSMDDLVTAWFAAEQFSTETETETAPERALDLGCGIGSVLMMIAWRFPAARCVGVEAQDVSIELARRSLALNGAADRCQVRHADFREPGALAADEQFDLITGTPPYFPRGEGVESDHVQRAPCRFEHRGGVEDYCAVAARHLAPAGLYAMCAAAGELPRVRAGAAAAGLAVVTRRDVVPRTGKAPLITLFGMRHSPQPPERVDPPLVVRDRAGQWTPELCALRHTMGLPPAV